MAKIRLNNEKRDALRQLAAQKLKDTPLPDGLQKQLDEARASFITEFDSYTKLVRRCLKAKWPAALLKPINDYGCLKKVDRTPAMTKEGEFFELQYPAVNYAGYYVACKAGCLFDMLLTVLGRSKVQATGKVQVTGKELLKEAFWFMPYWNQCTYDLKTGESRDRKYDSSKDVHRDTSGEAYAANRRFKTAVEELRAVEHLALQYLSKLKHSFHALIDSARTLEDVSAVWPEAEELRDEFLAGEMLPSVISDEAKRLIAENVAARSNGG